MVASGLLRLSCVSKAGTVLAILGSMQAVTVQVSESANTAVRPGAESAWSLLETAYAEACAVQAGCEDPSVVRMVRPDSDTTAFLALLGG